MLKVIPDPAQIKPVELIRKVIKPLFSMCEEFSSCTRAVLGQAVETAAEVEKGTEKFTFFPWRVPPGVFKMFMGIIVQTLIEGIKSEKKIIR